jgi:hypothetical protein
MTNKPLSPLDVKFFKALYALRLGPIVGRLVLLLTTTGRRSGLPRVTAQQYEELDGDIYLGSSRGTSADWVKNVLAHPRMIGMIMKSEGLPAKPGRGDLLEYAQKIALVIVRPVP